MLLGINIPRYKLGSLEGRQACQGLPTSQGFNLPSSIINACTVHTCGSYVFVAKCQVYASLIITVVYTTSIKGAGFIISDQANHYHCFKSDYLQPGVVHIKRPVIRQV